MHSNHKDSSFMRSPLTTKTQYDQRFCFTEAKTPFKDSSNNDCRNMGSYTDYKIGQGLATTQHYNNENMNGGLQEKAKGSNTGGNSRQH
jgi:hypothetical protein